MGRPLTRLERGQHIAQMLRGAWRSDPPPSRNVDFEAVLPHLQRTGAEALVWWKLHREHPGDPRLQPLEQSFHLQRVENFRLEFQIQAAVARFRAVAIEPILAKGWSIACLYPSPGIRPFGDFDLHVDPDHVDAAARTLVDAPEWAALVDLHEGVPDLADRSYADLFARSVFLPLCQSQVRVLAPEDHLRLLCLHFVRHGGWRPLWLCDVAAFVESLPASFAWDRVWHGHPTLTSWVRASLALALRLLGARVGAGGAGDLEHEARWLDDVVLAEWGSEHAGDSHSRDPLPMAYHLVRPWRLLTGLRRRLPNAIEAAFRMRTPPGQVRFACWEQARYCCNRAYRFAARLGSRFSSASKFHLHRLDD